MHLPGGSLDNLTCTVTTLLAAGSVGFAIRRARREAAPWDTNAFAATAAMIFAAQMVDFPVADGVSGHLVGGTLAGAILGPWLGLLAMTLVLIAQSLLAGDGGITTLGANVLTMGVVATWGGYALKNAIAARPQSGWKELAATSLAAWGSIVSAGAACALIWTAGSDVRLGNVLWPLLAVHAPIGVGEALITATALGAIALWNKKSSPAVHRVKAVAAFAIATLLATLVAPWASTLPDGLEYVAANIALWPESGDSFAPLPDYLFPGVENAVFATALAGALGTMAVFAAARYAGSRLLAPTVGRRR